MRCSGCPSTGPLLLLLLTTLLLQPAAPAARCPVLGPGADPQTKALLAPLVFEGTLAALVRRGPALRTTFRAGRTLKGPAGGPSVEVDFAARENPARCRGAPAPALVVGKRYLVFAARRRGRVLAVAEPDDTSKVKAVERVLCEKCAKAPTVRGMKERTLEVSSKLRLKCRISGNPPPRVAWFKDGRRIKTDSRFKIKTKRRHSHLVINKASLEDSGNYLCRATNVLGNDSSAAKVLITRTQTTTDSSTWHIKKLPCPNKNFCLNGGTCSFHEIIGEYVCQCADGYRGQRCESKTISALSIDF